jgi:hypothetical protein
MTHTEYEIKSYGSPVIDGRFGRGRCEVWQRGNLVFTVIVMIHQLQADGASLKNAESEAIKAAREWAESKLSTGYFIRGKIYHSIATMHGEKDKWVTDD